MEKAGWLDALRLSGGIWRIFKGAADQVVRHIRRAFVGRNRVLAFAFSNHGPLDLAAGAGVPGRNLGDAGKNLGTFGLSAHFSGPHVGTLWTGHGRERSNGDGGGSFPLVEHLANFRGSGDGR